MQEFLFICCHVAARRKKGFSCKKKVTFFSGSRSGENNCNNGDVIYATCHKSGHTGFLLVVVVVA
jgi:hypothetical protein